MERSDQDGAGVGVRDRLERALANVADSGDFMSVAAFARLAGVPRGTLYKEAYADVRRRLDKLNRSSVDEAADRRPGDGPGPDPAAERAFKKRLAAVATQARAREIALLSEITRLRSETRRLESRLRLLTGDDPLFALPSAGGSDGLDGGVGGERPSDGGNRARTARS